jgi:hypothetical protein
MSTTLMLSTTSCYMGDPRDKFSVEDSQAARIGQCSE